METWPEWRRKIMALAKLEAVHRPFIKKILETLDKDNEDLHCADGMYSYKYICISIISAITSLQTIKMCAWIYLLDSFFHEEWEKMSFLWKNLRYNAVSLYMYAIVIIACMWIAKWICVCIYFLLYLSNVFCLQTCDKDIDNEISKIKQSAPYLVIIGVPGDINCQIFVCAEKETVLECRSVSDAIIDLIAAYFTFNISYPKFISVCCYSSSTSPLGWKTARKFLWQ